MPARPDHLSLVKETNPDLLESCLLQQPLDLLRFVVVLVPELLGQRVPGKIHDEDLPAGAQNAPRFPKDGSGFGHLVQRPYTHHGIY
jgi:hypothetical protein